MQQALALQECTNTLAGLGVILLPKPCRALCRHPKLRQLPRLGRCLLLSHLYSTQRRQEGKHCMQDKVLWLWWFWQAGSVAINKMCLCRQINDKTGCFPPKLQGQGLEEQGLTLLVGLLSYRDEYLEKQHRVCFTQCCALHSHS